MRRRPRRGIELELKRAIVEDGCLEAGITLDAAALEHAIVTAINADPVIREHAVEPVNLCVTLY